MLFLFLYRIGNAYAVLSNPDKKRQYDVSGGEDPNAQVTMLMEDLISTEALSLILHLKISLHVLWRRLPLM